MRENKHPGLFRITRKNGYYSHRHSTARIQTLAVMVLCLTAGVIGITLISRYAVLPAQGIIDAVKNSLGQPAGLDMTPRTELETYASFQRPQGLTAMAIQASRQPVLATYDWKHADIQTWRLAVSILDVPSARIADNNAYLFRKLNPQRFHESLQLINGQTVPIMTDVTASGFSRVGFLCHGRYQAIVSLYGEDQHGEQDLQATLAMVLRSWHWQT